jgi:hypothetical protein
MQHVDDQPLVGCHLDSADGLDGLLNHGVLGTRVRRGGELDRGHHVLRRAEALLEGARQHGRRRFVARDPPPAAELEQQPPPPDQLGGALSDRALEVTHRRPRRDGRHRLIGGGPQNAHIWFVPPKRAFSGSPVSSPASRSAATGSTGAPRALSVSAATA